MEAPITKSSVDISNGKQLSDQPDTAADYRSSPDDVIPVGTADGTAAGALQSFSQLRPLRLRDYIGQSEICENLKVYIQAARKRNRPLDHVLLSGPPGLGKTSLARVLGYEMQVPIRSVSGPVIEKIGDLAAILTNIPKNGILFIDEIHRMRNTLEEILYGAMEDFKLDLIIGQGPMARTVSISIPPFTLVGATTRAGLLTAPLRDRFGILLRLNYYSHQELCTLALRSAKILKIPLQKEAAIVLAKRSRGTPRVVNRLLKRLQDFQQLQKSSAINKSIVDKSLARMGIDQLGLDYFDHQFLLLLTKQFQGKPVGLSTISAALSESPDSIQEIYEPFLIRQGFIQKTARGRVATPKAFEYLGVKLERHENSFLPL